MYVRTHYRCEFTFGLSLRIFTPPVSSRVKTGGVRTPHVFMYMSMIGGAGVSGLIGSMAIIMTVLKNRHRCRILAVSNK